MISVDYVDDKSCLEDPNYIDSLGKNPLHVAVQHECETLVKELIQKDCDVNLVDARGKSPIFYADFRNTKTIESLLVGGARMNMCDTNGNSPLHLAISMHSVKGSCLDSINLLLRAGVDINKLNNKGETALDRAVQLRFINIVEALLQNGAKVNRENCAISVLTVAAIAKDQALFKLLLDHDASVDFQNQNGTSPLDFIDWLTDSSTILAVIKRTIDINRRCSSGYALLHYAARKGNTILVKLLIEGGAEVDIRRRNP